MVKELIYPFDVNYILENKKKIKKQLLEESDNFIDKKIAVLGGFTTALVVQIMELFLLNNGIKATFYESEYNKFYEDALFDNEELESFNPDVIYICTNIRNIKDYPLLSDNEDNINELLNNEYQKYLNIWESIKQRYNCIIIQNNFEMPMYRLLGNRDVYDIHGKVNYVNRLNDRFNEYARNNENFYICDLNYISADFGLKNWLDSFYYHMYKYGINVNAVPYLSFNVSNIIKSIYGKNKKGFVLDLDNTLWGGVIGDDGIEGIKLGPEEAQGQFYSEFQRYIKQHKQLGLVLNIDSKNELENALEGLSHPDSELSADDFVIIKANWENKDKNFLEIAQELNVLPESLVLIDDNPAERHIVSKQLKGVVAPKLDMTQHFIEYIDRNGFFEVTTLSTDDLNRNEMYKENILRAKAEASFDNYKDYLLSLDMKGIIKEFEPIYYDRISQLSNKSNQFNLTTRRYSVADIEKMADDDNYITLYGKLIDKFGDNGLVSVVIGQIKDNVLDIILWIMSCRVLKRDLEYAMMDELVKKCKERNIDIIKGYYYPTKKNKMVKDFYSLHGFSKIDEDSDGNSIWLLKIDDYQDKNEVIEVEND